ncbi:MAG: nicotinate phosphoribosyltransferase [Gemmatimonadota bacterium]|nr:nicotinate phosphoribosyltransferase [Gemmatimonadota bacterium]
MNDFADPFHVSTPDAILRGRTTDVYFDRTLEVLEREGVDPHVVVEVRAKSLPDGWPWAILAGTDEARALLEPRKDARLRALPEGSPFGPREPVLTVEGRYRSFAELETPLLGLICQASGVATAAARCRIAAGERTVLSFGARRMHPAITPMIERAAYLGGCDGVSAIAAAERIGVEPTGTMPHALVLILGDTVRTARAFDEAFGDDVPTIVLIDTFQDEKFEALRVAEALEERLAGIRFDTPGSRRGDLLQLMRETRWELDRRGFEGVEFFVSGGIDERAIERLNPLADGYGVGTRISAAATVDFSLDIVEIEGSPVAKRGKESGRKALLVCDGCEARSVVPAAPKTATYPCPGCGASVPDALAPPEEPPPAVFELRDRVLAALDGMELDRPIASVAG